MRAAFGEAGGGLAEPGGVRQSWGELGRSWGGAAPALPTPPAPSLALCSLKVNSTILCLLLRPTETARGHTATQ